MSNNDKILLYLYKDIGLYWERVLSDENQRDRCSLLKNKGLNTFFRSERISFVVTTLSKVENLQLQPNELAYTDSQSSKVRSMIHHLRNSIMHGLYKVGHDNNKVWIDFKNMSKQLGKTTLRGKVELSKLKDMMNIIRNY
jgi:hypothetical protein